MLSRALRDLRFQVGGDVLQLQEPERVIGIGLRARGRQECIRARGRNGDGKDVGEELTGNGSRRLKSLQRARDDDIGAANS